MTKRVLMGVFYEDMRSAIDYAWSLFQEGAKGVQYARIKGVWQVSALQTIH